MKRKFDYTFRALGSLFVITFFRDDDGGLDAFVQTVFKRISHFEGEFSRFVPDSSLSVLNRLGRLSVSDEFLELLSVSGECYRRSSGYFNPLRNVALLGYSEDFESGNFVPEIPASPPRTDFENVRAEGREVILEP
ncbi:MAG: FAD:protein FMN transferase [Patescibacteria group bacterium]